MPTVAALRAQFGLQPPGDPYDPGVYAAVVNRHVPFIQTNAGTVLSGMALLPKLFVGIVPSWLKNRVIPSGVNTITPCAGQSIGGIRSGTFASIGAPAVGFASGIVAIAIPGAGIAIGAAASLFSSIIGKDNSAQLAAIAQQITCTVSSIMTQVISLLDQAVGSGQATPAQARAAYEQYATQLKQSLGNSQGLPLVIQFFEYALDAMGDFSENIFWPDLYPKPVVASPASPTMRTPTPAPANELVQAGASAPAAFNLAPTASTAVAVPNSALVKPGSPIVLPNPVLQTFPTKQGYLQAKLSTGAASGGVILPTTGGIVAPLIVVAIIVALVIFL